MSDMGKGDRKALRVLLWAVTAAAAAGTVWFCASDGRSAAVTRAPSAAAGQSSGAVLDINTAGTGALEELPGIGPALAERIVETRKSNGPFAGPEALMQVPGIGPATWEGMEPFVYFGE